MSKDPKIEFRYLASWITTTIMDNEMDYREPTRIREHGTIVTSPDNSIERIEALRQIVANKSYAKIDGIMVDLFSASAVMQVYDALNDTNKAKYCQMPVWKMAEIAFKLMK